jgi:hypothetical protein
MMSKLTTKYIESIKSTGRFGDGNGLFLIARQHGDRFNKFWMVRYSSPTTGKRRDMGLGSIRNLGLGQARAKAIEIRQLINQRIDPIESYIGLGIRKPHRASNESNQRSILACATLRQLSQDFFERHKITLRSEKYQRQWIANLERLVFLKIGDRRIDSLTADDFLQVLQPIALTTSETCRRVVIQLNMIFADCQARDKVEKNIIEKVKVLIRYSDFTLITK